MDQGALAAPHRVSSLGTSFLGTSPLGIRQKPYVALEYSTSHAQRLSTSTSALGRGHYLEAGNKQEHQPQFRHHFQCISHNFPSIKMIL